MHELHDLSGPPDTSDEIGIYFHYLDSAHSQNISVYSTFSRIYYLISILFLGRLIDIIKEKASKILLP